MGKFLSVISVAIFSLAVQAQTMHEFYCDQGKQLEAQANHEDLINKYMIENTQGFAEIAKDAKSRFYISTAIGVTSTMLLTWEMSSAMLVSRAGTTGGVITQLITKLQTLNSASVGGAAGSTVVAVAAGQTLAFSMTKVLANVLLTSVAFDGVPVFVGPMIYVAGRIAYVLNASKGSITYVVPDVEEAEAQLQDQIAKIEMDRTEAVESSPGLIANSLSFGEANYDHYAKIVNLSTVETQLRAVLIKVQRTHAQVLMSNCGK